jgi:restriction system protein
MAKRTYRRKKDALSNHLLLGSFVVLIAFYFVSEYPLAAIAVVLTIIASVALYFYFQWKERSLKREKTLQSGINEIDVMPGVAFENYLGVLFEVIGYEVTLTAGSGDYGADLLLEKDGKSIAVQAKRYDSTVGIKSVQEVFSAKMYYRTHEAWVVTNNTFSKNACELAKRSGVKLVARDQLINFITENMTDNAAPTFTIHTWNEE